MSCVRLRLEQAMAQQKRQLRELFRDADAAKSRLAELNEWICLLAMSGVVDGQVVLGKEVLSLSYRPCEGGHDSGPCFQAALIVPEGLGVIQMDSDAFVSLRGITEGIEANAVTSFVPLMECRPVVLQWLLPQIDGLVEKMMALLPTELRTPMSRRPYPSMTSQVYFYRRPTNGR